MSRSSFAQAWGEHMPTVVHDRGRAVDRMGGIVVEGQDAAVASGRDSDLVEVYGVERRRTRAREPEGERSQSAPATKPGSELEAGGIVEGSSEEGAGSSTDREMS